MVKVSPLLRCLFGQSVNFACSVEGESSQLNQPLLLPSTSGYKPLSSSPVSNYQSTKLGALPDNVAYINTTIHTRITSSPFFITMSGVYSLNWMSLQLFAALVTQTPYVLLNLGFVMKLGTMRSPSLTIQMLDLIGTDMVEAFLCTSRMIFRFPRFPLVLLV